jgi:hypothetical protein
MWVRINPSMAHLMVIQIIHHHHRFVLALQAQHRRRRQSFAPRDQPWGGVSICICTTSVYGLWPIADDVVRRRDLLIPYQTD